MVGERRSAPHEPGVPVRLGPANGRTIGALTASCLLLIAIVATIGCKSGSGGAGTPAQSGSSTTASAATAGSKIGAADFGSPAASGGSVTGTVVAAGSPSPAGATSSAAAATANPTSAAPPPTATATQPATLGPNLVSNGGFETGSLNSWGTGIYEPRPQGVFWGAADADATVVSDVVHSGGFALRIANRSAVQPQVYRTMSQKVAVKGGVTHCLTFWARTVSGTSGILGFRLNDAWTQNVGIGAGSATWTAYKGQFTTEDGNIDLRIVSENTGTVWVDDIALREGACP